jgi:hypothetical protein
MLSLRESAAVAFTPIALLHPTLPLLLLLLLLFATLQVPQGMSYATLAGVPSVWGLYGAFIPVLMYSVFGSSRQLAVGPVAVTSLLIGNGIKKVVPGELRFALQLSCCRQLVLVSASTYRTPYSVVAVTYT